MHFKLLYNTAKVIHMQKKPLQNIVATGVAIES